MLPPNPRALPVGLVASVVHPDEDRRSLLLFRLAGHTLAIAARDVVEVAPVVRITELPGAPLAVEGMIRFRGAVVAVLDLRGRFGIGSPPVALDEHLVVVRAGARTVAFRVDHALRLVELRDRDLAAAEALVPGVRHVRAVAHVEGDLIYVHDPATFLDAAEGARLDQALARLSAREVPAQ
jgi:purine-binding chemotaxis protein CheW